MPASVDLEKETVITGRVVDGSGHSVQSDRPRELVEIIRAALG